MIDQDEYLPASAVLARYKISAMSLWRWSKQDDLQFPQPLRINNRRFWLRSALESWEQTRSPQAA
jgi:predicted DNA-binding transcriptional regulator AlpA